MSKLWCGGHNLNRNLSWCEHVQWRYCVLSNRRVKTWIIRRHYFDKNHAVSTKQPSHELEWGTIIFSCQAEGRDENNIVYSTTNWCHNWLASQKWKYTKIFSLLLNSRHLGWRGVMEMNRGVRCGSRLLLLINCRLQHWSKKTFKYFNLIIGVF